MKFSTIILLGLFFVLASFNPTIHGQSNDSTLFALADSDAEEFAPSWSSDGEYVYWVRRFSSTEASRTEFYETELASLQSNLILSIDAYVYEPKWSPDGQSIAYVDLDNLLHILDRQGNEQASFSDVSFYVPFSWSPDSQGLAAYQGRNIAFLKRDGSQEILFESASIATADWGLAFSWSADSQKLLLAHASEILLLEPNATALRLTQNDYDELAPVFSPDGSKIAYVALRENQFRLYLMNADGSEQVQISESQFGDFCPQWSPDGQALAFLRGDAVEIYGATMMRYELETGQISWLERPDNQSLRCPRWSPDGQNLALESYSADVYLAAASAFKTEVSETEIHYEVAFVPENLSVNVYADAGRTYIGSLANGADLSITGVIEDEWIGIEYEGQDAWIHQRYLIGTIDPILFCRDSRIMPLIENLQNAIRNRDGEAFASLIAPHGLYVGLQGQSQYLSYREANNFFDDHEARFWGRGANTGEPIIRSMADDVLPLLDEDLLGENLSMACQDNQDNLSDNSVLYAVYAPNYQAFPNFYSLMRPGAPGYELDWGAWGIAFSYWEDEPKIIALGHYHWTP